MAVKTKTRRKRKAVAKSDTTVVYTVLKGIPIPPVRRAGRPADPLREVLLNMPKLGCIEIPTKKAPYARRAFAEQREHGKRYTTRTDGGTTRIWRVQ